MTAGEPGIFEPRPIGSFGSAAEHRETERLAEFAGRMEPLVNLVGDDGRARAECEPNRQRQRENQGRLRPNRDRGRRFDRLGADPAEISDQLGLFQLIDDRVEQRSLAFKVVAEVGDGQTACLGFLRFGHVGVELGADFGLHRLDGFQAFFDGPEQFVRAPRARAARRRSSSTMPLRA